MNGAELVRKLAESGTGEAKLDVARKTLVTINDQEQRLATAEEVLAAMESAGVSEGTLEKARSIIQTGKWDGVRVEKEKPVEERLLEQMALPEPQKPQPVVNNKPGK